MTGKEMELKTPTSCETDDGIPAVLEQLRRFLVGGMGASPPVLVGTHPRQPKTRFLCTYVANGTVCVCTIDSYR